MKLSTALKNLIGRTLLYIVLIDLAMGALRAIQLRWDLFPTLNLEAINLGMAFLVLFLTRRETRLFRDERKQTKPKKWRDKLGYIRWKGLMYATISYYKNKRIVSSHTNYKQGKLLWLKVK